LTNNKSALTVLGTGRDDMAISKHFSEQYQWWYFYDDENGQTWWMEQPPEPEGPPPWREQRETRAPQQEQFGAVTQQRPMAEMAPSVPYGPFPTGYQATPPKGEDADEDDDPYGRRVLGWTFAILVMVLFVIFGRAIGGLIGHALGALFF
jgi:hypothetical protein